MIDTSAARATGSGPVALTAYVDHSFEDVCHVLDSWSNTWHAGLEVGELERPAKFVARVNVRDRATNADGELRVLPVLTGCGPVTELLLVVPTTAAWTRSELVTIGRAHLENVTREVDSAFTGIGGQSS